MKKETQEVTKPKNQVPPLKILSRDDVLKILGDCINALKQKSVSGRFRDLDLEKARDAKVRLMIYGCQVFLSGIKDKELEDLEKRIVDLEGAS